MLFRQFVDDDLGCASYLIGDEQAGVAVVVDPAYAIEPYLDAARGTESSSSASSRPTRTPTTSRVTAASRSSTALPVHVHDAAGAAFPHQPLADGTEIDLGAGRDPHASTPRATVRSTARSP